MNTLCRQSPSRWVMTLFVALLATSACTDRTEDEAPKLKIPSDKAALSFVDGFFQAYVRTDLDSLRGLLCEQDEAQMFRIMTFIQESQAPMSPFRVDTFQVRSAAPVWIGRAPYFRVEVSFPRRRSPGQLLHVYQVNAKEGCLQGFLDEASDGPAVRVPERPSPNADKRKTTPSPDTAPKPNIAPPNTAPPDVSPHNPLPPPSVPPIPEGVEVIEL